MKGVVRRIVNHGRTPVEVAEAQHAVVIIGGGAAGIAAASSLLAREPGLDIAIIDPADMHYYQPGWTLVGGGVFDAPQTARTMASTIPRGVHWIKSAVAAFEPETQCRHPRWLPRRQIRATGRVPWPEAQLACHRRACPRRWAATA